MFSTAPSFPVVHTHLLHSGTLLFGTHHTLQTISGTLGSYSGAPSAANTMRCRPQGVGAMLMLFTGKVLLYITNYEADISRDMEFRIRRCAA